ncbi:MAG TPA: OsmC family protein [Candidatus Acidoferrales bacterium]|nr:OsmC family protein [Candidatus Acidoferrales bacterium]
MLSISPNLKQIVQRQLEERGARKPGETPRPVTTVKSKALHDVQFRATVEGHSFISDEREAGGGSDAGPAPLRYFLAGIMMCHQVWTVKSAALADVRLDKLEGEISGYVSHGNPGGFERITFTVTVDSPSPAEEIRKIVAQAAERCAAFVTVARGCRIELTLMHNGKKTDERVYGGGGVQE